MSLDVQHVGVPSIYNSDGSFLECNCYLGVTNALKFLVLNSSTKLWKLKKIYEYFTTVYLKSRNISLTLGRKFGVSFL